uniref:Glycosyltransferase n=1 Tax=Erysipelothrix tonsillarum TaxID=38402 RepID=A0A6S6I5C3_9FIRM|nr:glycosyltransferase [Erysipelothrix tonsillarum]
MIKALYLGGFELPDKNAAAHRVKGVGKILSLQGVSVFYSGIYRGDTSNLDNQIKYPSSISEWFKYLFSSRQWIKIIEETNPSLVILYNFPAISSKKIIKYCKKNNIKILGDITEWYTAEGNIIFRCIKGFDIWMRMRVINYRYDGLITISKYLTDFYSEKIKTFEIPPVNSLGNKILKNSVNEEQCLKLVYSGSPGKSKDYLRIIIDSLYDLRENKFVYTIIGQTKESFLEFNPEYNLPLSELGEKVIFLGRIEHQQALDFISNNDFSLFVRENNRTVKAGFPTKLTEAISLGIPVITNPHSNVSDFLIDGVNSIVIKSLTKEGVTDALRRVMKMDRSEIENMKNSIDRNQFCPENYLEKLSVEEVIKC